MKKQGETSRVKRLYMIVGVAFVLLLNVMVIAMLFGDDPAKEDKAGTKVESDTLEESNTSELEVDRIQVIREARELSEGTMQTVTAELDEYYSNLRGFSDVEEIRTFQVYWDVDWEKYVVIMDQAANEVSGILNVRSETSVSLYDAKKQIANGNYATGGELVLLHDGVFTMEPTTMDQEELLRYVGGYMTRMISGVGVERSGGKPYGVKVFLDEFTYDDNTSAMVYYDCGYERLENALGWDYFFDSQSHLYLDNMRIITTGQPIEEWMGDFASWSELHLDWDKCVLFLDGTLEETSISTESKDSVDWGPMLHAAWILWLDGKETIEGTIKGEIYLSDVMGSGSDHPTYKGWICLDGEEPVKVSAKDSDELAKTVNIDETAVLGDAEKETALGKLTFELTIGRSETSKE